MGSRIISLSSSRDEGVKICLKGQFPTQNLDTVDITNNVRVKCDLISDMAFFSKTLLYRVDGVYVSQEPEIN